MERYAEPNPFRIEETDMPPKDFKCIQCGNCCMNLYDAFSTCATEDDIAMWQNEGREDILEWVSPIQLGTHFVYDIWINPVAGDDFQRCPWLRKLPKQDKYVCRIHDLKPEHCRAYPRSREHARKTGRTGFDE
jgi:Fe-S-cluster containining protein